MPSSATTLKSYFETGDKPTAAQFAELVDGNLNLNDGGTVTGNVTLNGRLTRTSPETMLAWNYITCPAPIVSQFGTSADGALADGDQFGIAFPGVNGELVPSTAYSVGAFSAAGTVPTVEGTIPATDTATTSAGLNLQMDAATTDNVGIEIIFGGNALGGGHGITVGTHTATIDATIHAPDYSDFDCVSFGFRKIQAFQAGHGAVLAAANGDPLYTDFAGIGRSGAADLFVFSDLNDSGTIDDIQTTQDATDNQNMRFKVSLASNGAVTYQHVQNAVAGAGTLAAPSTTDTFTFDNADVLVPYMVILGTSVNDKISLKDITITRSPGISYQN
jgi:hypothetical protein